MGVTASGNIHQSDTKYVEAGLGVDKTSKSLMDLQSNRNKVSTRRGWNSPSLPRHDDIVVYIHYLHTTLYFLTDLQTNYLCGAEVLVQGLRSFSYSRNSQYFMEPQDTLMCSQELSTGHYPEPDEWSPYQSILFL
jgi:hypothetical protein